MTGPHADMHLSHALLSRNRRFPDKTLKCRNHPAPHISSSRVKTKKKSHAEARRSRHGMVVSGSNHDGQPIQEVTPKVVATAVSTLMTI